MANRPGQKVYPRGARRTSMYQVGDRVSTDFEERTIVAVRKQTAKYSKHYALNMNEGTRYLPEIRWFRRDQLSI